MKYLLDTHFLLWIADDIRLVPRAALPIIEDLDNVLYFSAASIWEVSVKHSLKRPDFRVDPARLLETLLENGYIQLPMSGLHALSLGKLPHLHKDPFDRILIAQAVTENMTLLTVDSMIAQYPGPIRKV